MANLPPKIRWAIFVAVALLALALRLPRLDERPMHTDEAINAYITGDLLGGKAYQYDPRDRHGPALYAIAFPIAKLAGAKTFGGLTETSVRIGPVIIGALTILLFGALVNQIGLLSAIGAALLFAISPLPVYYSRDFIHETLFVAATLMLIVFAFRVLENKSLLNGIFLGVAAGLMLGCKETAILHFPAFGAAALWWFAPTLFRNPRSIDWRSAVKPGIAALAAFCFVLLALYSWGGLHFSGLTDLAHSFPHLASRATGEGHEKPAWYYVALLGSGWSGFGVLALALLGAFNRPRQSASGRVFQALVVYTISIALLYSAIPYKTPWLALNLWLSIALLAGHGFALLWIIARNRGGRAFVSLLGIALLVGLCRDTWQRVFVAPAGERNPYAYAHTVEDILRLPKRIEQLAEHSGPGKDLRIAVVAADPWPLPWYLRKFPQVGFWQPGQDPGTADIYITSPEAAEKLGLRLENRRPEFFGVRPEVLMLLWRPPTVEPGHE